METLKTKVSVILLIFVVILTLRGSHVKEVNAKICPQICFDAYAYMTCPTSGNERLNPPCNCCMAPFGCTIYYSNGSPVSC
ncbi:hypothetical protein RND81_01G212100 [Saponaria officinalis]|uniref:Uncharacterized protein n=1 Tax=Saponaria officinalis TaxID=3572 RepID=A0AAW1NHF8_SAPOF